MILNSAPFCLEIQTFTFFCYLVSLEGDFSPFVPSKLGVFAVIAARGLHMALLLPPFYLRFYFL
jgi:hypothetical protein